MYVKVLGVWRFVPYGHDDGTETGNHFDGYMVWIKGGLGAGVPGEWRTIGFGSDMAMWMLTDWSGGWREVETLPDYTP